MKLAFLLALIQLIAEPCCAFNPLPCRAYTIQGRCTSLRARHSIPSHSFYSISHFSTGHISRPLAAGAKGSREMATDTDSVGLGRQDILSAAARRAFVVMMLSSVSASPALALLESDEQEEEEEEEEEQEQEDGKALSPVAIGLKGLVVAGTMYGIADLFTGPKIEQETRRGPEASGQLGKEAIRDFVGTAAADDVPPTLGGTVEEP